MSNSAHALSRRMPIGERGRSGGVPIAPRSWTELPVTPLEKLETPPTMLMLVPDPSPTKAFLATSTARTRLPFTCASEGAASSTGALVVDELHVPRHRRQRRVVSARRSGQRPKVSLSHPAIIRSCSRAAAAVASGGIERQFLSDYQQALSFRRSPRGRGRSASVVFRVEGNEEPW